MCNVAVNVTTSLIQTVLTARRRVLCVGDPFSSVLLPKGYVVALSCYFIVILCNERVKSRLCAQRSVGVMFLKFVLSDCVFSVSDVSPSTGLSHVRVLSGRAHLPKVMLWCEREILDSKNVISEGTQLNNDG